MSKKALLLVGSPKKNSTSEVLGNHVLEGIEKNGFHTEKVIIHKLLKNDDGAEQLINAVNSCDLLIFSAPLYIDCPPALAIKAMEIIAELGAKQEGTKRPLIAICNCGFPEAHQNQTSLEIYKHFAKQSGFEWAGGLALGGGQAINGRPLASFGGMTRNIISSLNLVIESIIEGKQITQEAFELMEKPMFPKWLYLIAGDAQWKSAAKKNGVNKRLKAKPYKD